jgi:SAM-dependent methyltransferase
MNSAGSFDAMAENVNILDEAGFARLLGTTADDIETQCGPLLRGYDFRYRILRDDALKDTVLKVIKTMDESPLSVSGRNRHQDWEKGWGENLQEFQKSKGDLDALVPKYMHKFPMKRLFADYIEPLDRDFEINFYKVYRHYLFKTYLAGYDPVFEFGCGTGYNLAIMARLFPEKSFWGLDWSENAVSIVDALAFSLGLERLRGRLFDYFSPDDSLEIPGNAAVITLNSLEQMGDDYGNFLDFLLRKSPPLCINSEPFVEMYDESDLLDYLAARYHRRRNYLRGYLPALKRLEADGIIEILKEQRVRLGNLFHDGYSLVIWRVAG